MEHGTMQRQVILDKWVGFKEPKHSKCKHMGNFAKNLNLGKHVLPPALGEVNNYFKTIITWRALTMTQTPVRLSSSWHTEKKKKKNSIYTQDLLK